MQRHTHEQQSAIGACVGCGKFIRAGYGTKVKGKNYCKVCVDGLFTKKEKEVEEMGESLTLPPLD